MDVLTEGNLLDESGPNPPPPVLMPPNFEEKTSLTKHSNKTCLLSSVSNKLPEGNTEEMLSVSSLACLLFVMSSVSLLCPRKKLDLGNHGPYFPL